MTKTSYYFQIILISVGCISLTISHYFNKDIKPKLLYSWKTADFLYADNEERNHAIEQGLYIPKHVAILDSDYYFSHVTSTKRVFVTTPQFKSGIPATLSEITRQQNGESYLLRPFPGWEAQRSSTCEGLTSVFRIHIDKCGLLWVLDSGRVNLLRNSTQLCPPKILIYDLNNNDKLIDSYEFPEDSITDRSYLITLITESYSNDCLDSIAYIADANAYGLIVYDFAKKASWRINHNIFYPFPHKGTFTIADVTFDLMDGVFGLALDPPDSKNRKLYFHSLASVRESWVPLSVLKNDSLFKEPDVLRKQIYISEDARDGQSSLEVMTDDGILIYALLPKNALACWNSATPFTRKNQHTIYVDHENLQFISGMKLKNNKALLITSSRFQNYITDKTNPENVNYRMLVFEDVEELIKDTPCKAESFHHGFTKPSIGFNHASQNLRTSSVSIRTTTHLNPFKTYTYTTFSVPSHKESLHTETLQHKEPRHKELLPRKDISRRLKPSINIKEGSKESSSVHIENRKSNLQF